MICRFRLRDLTYSHIHSSTLTQALLGKLFSRHLLLALRKNEEAVAGKRTKLWLQFIFIYE